MRIDILPAGVLQANCYVLSEDDDCIVIDPGGEGQRLVAHCEELGRTPATILLTHGHVDHIAAACELQSLTGATIWAHPEDRNDIEHPHPYFVQMVGGVEPCQVGGELAEGQQFTIGQTILEVIHTPGHSPGSVCFVAPGVIFTGDTLFAGSVGRTDLPGGSWAALNQSLRRLLLDVPAETVVYPGHGPQSTMAEESATNEFLLDLQ